MSEKLDWLVKVEALAKQASQQEGCLLYDVEFVGVGKGRTLRVYIDKEDGSISIDDCSNVSKALDVLLDGDSVIPGDSYNLEVSTPGLDRSLKQRWHFEKVVGKKIYVKTEKVLESYGITEKKWKAAKTVEHTLKAVSEDGIQFEDAGISFTVPFIAIDRAKVVFDMNKGTKK